MRKIVLSIYDLNKAPVSIGVYVFKDKDGRAVYIGKSVNIRSRLKAHLRSASFSEKERKIFEKSQFVEVYPVSSEYSALLLESKLIREERPMYNKIWMDDKSYLYIKVTNEEFPKVYPVRQSEIKDALAFFGPFSSLNVVNSVLRSIRKIFPFCSQKKIGKRACFYSKLGLCNPCPSEIVKVKDKRQFQKLKRQYRKNINGLIKLLNGDVDYIRKFIVNQLERLKKEEKYEEAIKVREQLKRLESLSFLRFEQEEGFDVSKLWEKLADFLKDKLKIKNLTRIECYDISNIKGKEAVGSMVVMVNGLMDKSQYRRFKIRYQKGDQNMLGEVVLRRFKNNWPLPDLILVDGGEPQVKLIKKVLKKIKVHIPVIGIAKNPDRLVFVEKDSVEYISNFRNNQFLNLLRLLRDESHRFAKKYHLILRKKKLII